MKALLLAILCPAMLAHAQSSTPKHHAAPPWHQKKIAFTDEKAILGLPTPSGRSANFCSGDGTSFIQQYADSVPESSSELFSVAPNGEVKHLLRKMPFGFTSIYVRDFFAGDQTLVTLLEAQIRDDDLGITTPRDTEYFLSLSDHEGAGAELLHLELKFKPLKIAQFGSGEFLVLGWDPANDQPMLAILKDDGSIRRFMDFDDHRRADPNISYNSIKEAEASPQERVTATTLQRIQLIPYGSQVMLAYPGTAKAVRILSSVGEDHSIPIMLPAGFVLHDVLVSNEHEYSFFLRAEPPAEETKPAAKIASAPAAPAPPPPQQRLFEMSAYHGDLIRELLVDKPALKDITCAAPTRFTAIFADALPDAAPPPPTPPDMPPADPATQLVVATASR